MVISTWSFIRKQHATKRCFSLSNGLAYLIDDDSAICSDERCVEVEDNVDEEGEVNDGVDDQQGDVVVGQASVERKIVRDHDHRVER